jgi:hypothetical protein
MREELMNCAPMDFLSRCLNKRIIQDRDVDEIEAFLGSDFLKISFPKRVLTIGERKKLQELVITEFMNLYGKHPEIKHSHI